jgi:broad-specificity NMP kinase
MDDQRERFRPRIVVVGPCASGKSTLANQLRELGHDVRVSGQEHSSIRNLWQKIEHDLLVALETDLDTVRARRSPSWPEDIYQRQQERLRDAYAAADVVIDTAVASPDEVVRQVLDLIGGGVASSGQTAGPKPGPVRPRIPRAGAT